MLHVIGASGSRPTTDLLRRMLASAGVPIVSYGGQYRATFSYGVPIQPGPRTLGGSHGLTKRQELDKLAQGGVATPETKESLTEEDFTRHPVWYARKAEHRGGTDIRVVTQADEAGWRKAAGWDFFTARLKVAKEYRIWMFRGHHCGTYEKTMADPAQYTGVGRNYKNGFSFNRFMNPPEDLKQLVDSALTSLGLDFGAADVVMSPEGKYSVLEVNTAPGIEHERRTCAVRLVDNIKKWYNAL